MHLHVRDMHYNANVTLRMYPRGEYDTGRPPGHILNETDFDTGFLYGIDLNEPNERPHNEVLILREFREVGHCGSGDDEMYAMEHCLVLVGVSLIHRYMETFEVFFEVDRETDIEPVFEGDRAVGWEIFKVTKRREEETAKMLDGMPDVWGFDIGTLKAVRKNAGDNEVSVQTALRERGIRIHIRKLQGLLKDLTERGVFDENPAPRLEALRELRRQTY